MTSLQNIPTTSSQPASLRGLHQHGAPQGYVATLGQHAATIQLDACAREHTGMNVIWERLTAGSWRVVDHFTTEARLYLVVREQQRPVSPPEADLLLRTLLGERQKTVAIDLDLSPSTLTTRLGSSLIKMGFLPKPARVPILLVATAAAAHGYAKLCDARLTRLPAASGEVVVLSTARFDTHLRLFLSPTEWLVSSLVVDGLSHREIAEKRGCAVRTVANQVSSIFRKLGISGRPELLLHAVTRHGDEQADRRNGPSADGNAS
jgi:DNA-binding CsgD family transcriptional regulator